jgi:hypothetical protein
MSIIIFMALYIAHVAFLDQWNKNKDESLNSTYGCIWMFIGIGLYMAAHV